MRLIVMLAGLLLVAVPLLLIYLIPDDAVRGREGMTVSPRQNRALVRIKKKYGKKMK